jgi:hypothetical protein
MSFLFLGNGNSITQYFISISWLSGYGTSGEGKFRLSQDICGFCLQTLTYKLGEGEGSQLVEGDGT